MEPKVSVILPVYNVGKYLRQCMDSIAAQTLQEIEVICIDDGSSDDSQQILQEYARKDQRVKVACQQNQGAGAARNRGLSMAQGEYLSFLDSDDFFEADMLEKAYQKAKEAKAQLLVFRSDQYHEDRDEFVKIHWTLRKADLPPYRPMNHRTFTGNVFKVFVGWAWDKLFERSFILEHGLEFQEQRTSNDLLFVFSALVLAKRVEILDEVLAHQRRNNKESLSNTRERSWQCFYEALRALKGNLERFGLYQELEQDYINYALHFSLWNLNTITGPKKETLFERLKGEWFEALGVCGKEEGYFYNKKEYEDFLRIISHDFQDLAEIG